MDRVLSEEEWNAELLKRRQMTKHGSYFCLHLETKVILPVEGVDVKRVYKYGSDLEGRGLPSVELCLQCGRIWLFEGWKTMIPIR